MPGFGSDGHHGCHCGQWPLPQAVLDDLNDDHSHSHEDILEVAHQHAHRTEHRSAAMRLGGDGKAAYGAVDVAEEMVREPSPKKSPGQVKW